MAQDIRNMRPDFISAPATSFKLLTTGNQTPPTRAVYVSVGGTVNWTDLEGQATTGIALTAGNVIPIALVSIESLGSATLYGLR